VPGLCLGRALSVDAVPLFGRCNPGLVEQVGSGGLITDPATVLRRRYVREAVSSPGPLVALFAAGFRAAECASAGLLLGLQVVK
jgi:hypothetical protein